MFYGQFWGAYGDPDRHTKDFEVVATANGAKVRIEAAEDLGDAYYQVYVNNAYSGSVWCAEGYTSDWLNVNVPTAGSASIVCFRIGAQPLGDNSLQSRHEEEAPKQVKAVWSWAYETLGTPDNAKLTSWTIAGLRRLQTIQTDKITRGEVPVAITVTGGTATVEVGTLCSGSGAVGGSVTLSAINESGVSGSVTVAADTTTGTATLKARWPKSMRILRDTTNPPTTIIETVPFNGADNGELVDTTILTPATYYYAYQGISDTDDIGTKSTAESIAVTGAPDAPEDLAYVSGNAATTTVGWEASDTVGATYNIYIQNVDDDFLNTYTPSATAAAGATSKQLPAITGYPGRAQVLVRAESGGIEEKNGTILALDYDASGVYIAKRPNAPVIRAVTVSSGLSMAVACTYTTNDESASPASLQLFTRTPSGSYNFTSPDATASLGTESGGVRTGTVSATKVTDGWYFATVKTVTSGGVQCDGNAPEVAVYVSDDDISAPVGTFTLTRG